MNRRREDDDTEHPDPAWGRGLPDKETADNPSISITPRTLILCIIGIIGATMTATAWVVKSQGDMTTSQNKTNELIKSMQGDIQQVRAEVKEMNSRYWTPQDMREYGFQLRENNRTLMPPLSVPNVNDVRAINGK